MGRVMFLFNKESDEFNIWSTCSDPVKYDFDFAQKIKPTICNTIKGKKFEECKDIIYEINAELYNSPFIPIILKSIEEAWGIIEGKYIERIQKVTGKPFYSKPIKGYATTIGKCSYNPQEGTFMFNVFSGLLNTLKTIGHELFHLQFHEYFFEDLKKEVGYTAAHDIKEAVTVLLNLEFNDLWIVQDKGYDSHKSLREFISTEWLKEKDFNDLLNKCIKYVKNVKGGSIKCEL